jgi:ParB family chromosome partitioning protein
MGTIKTGKKAGASINFIDVASLHPSQTQPRSYFDEEKIRELASSIQVHGILQPILVKKVGESFAIIAGERRFRAAQIVGLKKIPSIVLNIDNEQAFLVALVENLQREDLNPIEEAIAYERLRSELKLNQEDLAQYVGKDRATIANTMRLLKLPEKIQAMLIRRELSMGHARCLLSLDGDELMALVAKKCIREALSVRRLEALIRALKDGRERLSGQEKKGESLSLSPIEKEIRLAVEHKIGVRCELKKDSNSYVLSLNFPSSAEINAFLELLAIEL